jgi:dTDP-4-dehydrorhamnose reductase
MREPVIEVPVLVLGSEGMLGQACTRWLERYQGWGVGGTTYLDHKHPLHFDVLEGLGKLCEILRKRRYNYAINCIGVLSSAISNSDWRSVETAIRVNALFPHQLAATAMEYGCRVIHISTDGVFSGNSTGDYTENSPVDCPDTYGRTKGLGECAADNVLNIRCSIIGRDWMGGKGILEWVLRMPPGSSVTGFCDYVWSPVTTFQFAELCRRIMEGDAFERLRAESSVHHFAPNRAISKYELLAMLNEITGRHLQIQRGSSTGGPIRRVLANRSEAIPRLYQTGEEWPDVLRGALQDI